MPCKTERMCNINEIMQQVERVCVAMASQSYAHLTHYQGQFDLAGIICHQ